MQVEHRITIATSADTIFRIYEDVQHWHTWDPDTKQAYIAGPFRAGVRGRITPPKGMSVPMLFTQVKPGKCFTVESKIPLFCMVFEHELHELIAPLNTTETTKATEVVHRVTFSGALSFLLGPILSKQLNAGLPVTLRNLKMLAEKTSAA